MVNVSRLVTTLFGPPEEIWPPRNFCSSLSRWTLIQNKHFTVCLNHFVGAHGGASLDQYREPFISVGVTEATKHPVGDRPLLGDRGAWMVLFSRRQETRTQIDHN